MLEKTVLITGAAKRIGREIALSMAEAGWNVAVHYNYSGDEAEETAQCIRRLGVRACIIRADMMVAAQVPGILAQANEQVGPVTCLVNNASVFKNDNILNLTHESWHENVTVNLYAPVLLIQAFIKQLPDARPPGMYNIINMLDYAVWRYPEKFLSYTASKAGLWALTGQLAYSLAGHHIRINAIGPGNTLPNQHESKERFMAARLASPLGVGADTDEICRAVHFILASPSMTGQMIALDGGKHLVGPEGY